MIVGGGNLCDDYCTLGLLCICHGCGWVGGWVDGWVSVETDCNVWVVV